MFSLRLLTHCSLGCPGALKLSLLTTIHTRCRGSFQRNIRPTSVQQFFSPTTRHFRGQSYYNLEKSGLGDDDSDVYCASAAAAGPSDPSSSSPVLMPPTARTTETLPESEILIFTTLESYRQWRRTAFRENKTVGFVPTMGALHEGHLTLVRRSLAENDLTVLSIFVNPAQFAPHEDLATYPRTLEQDIRLLEAIAIDVTTTGSGMDSGTESADQSCSPQNDSPDGASTRRTPSAILLPSVKEMYPSGISQDVSVQTGAFVEVKGYGHQMEGMSRPTFFRGVATVVTKLFNAVQPTNAYFGQKDIQQALLLRRLSRDLLLANPEPQNVHIVPTARDLTDNLALSSRNAYLTPQGRSVAGTLNLALRTAEEAWCRDGATKRECLESAVEVVESKKREICLEGVGVDMRLDYIEVNDPDTFDVVGDDVRKVDWESEGRERRPVILSGAMWVDRTRLIDNVILGDVGQIVSL